MRSGDKLYDVLLSELEGIEPDLLTTEKRIPRADRETIAEVLSEAAGEVISERLEELFNTIEIEFTIAKEDLQ